MFLSAGCKKPEIQKPDSPADTEPAPAAEKEPANPAEPCSTPEPEPNIMPDQVREWETMPIL